MKIFFVSKLFLKLENKILMVLVMFLKKEKKEEENLKRATYYFPVNQDKQ